MYARKVKLWGYFQIIMYANKRNMMGKRDKGYTLHVMI